MRHFFLVISLFSLLVHSPASTAASVPKPADLAESFNSFLEHAAAYGFSGTVLLSVDGKILVHKGYGLADRARNIPVMADDVFDIGSITKQFTAAAIMKLEMQGKLKTEDLLSKYIDGVPVD